MYCTSRCRNSTHQCEAANYPVLWVAVQGREWKYAKFRAYQSPWYCISTKAMVISKGSYGYGELKNVLPLSFQKQYLPVRGRKLPHFMGAQYRAGNRNMRKFGHTNPYGTVFALKQWLYQKDDTGMESSKMYCHRRCRHSTYQCGAANYPIS